MKREEDRKKFISLAEKRVSKTLKDIQLIGNLANKSNYSYEDEDPKKIYQALKKAIDDMKAKFDNNTNNNDTAFKL